MGEVGPLYNQVATCITFMKKTDDLLTPSWPKPSRINSWHLYTTNFTHIHYVKLINQLMYLFQCPPKKWTHFLHTRITQLGNDEGLKLEPCLIEENTQTAQFSHTELPPWMTRLSLSSGFYACCPICLRHFPLSSFGLILSHSLKDLSRTSPPSLELGTWIVGSLSPCVLPDTCWVS